MDSQGFIELQRMPYQDRLEKQYTFHQQEVEQGCLLGREGDGAAKSTQLYKDLFTDEFREVLNFGSNNYLGMSYNPYVLDRVKSAIDKYGLGTGGSPAFSGYTSHHRNLEKRLASLAGHEDSVLLPSGFMANLCWVAGLMNRQDVLLYDKYSHASVINAIKMAGVPFFGFDPEDLAGFVKLVHKVKERAAPNAQIFATVEGVRSIDGTVIELTDWIRICKEEGLITILDDAHGLGTLGAQGHGTLQHLDLLGQVDFRMSTCSKGLGCQGAFVSGDTKGIFYLRSFSNPYVFTTALAHPTVAAIDAGLDVMEQEPELLARLHLNVEYMRAELEDMGHRVGYSPAGIIPVFLPDGVARNFNRDLYAQGLFAHVMEYPMVPPGQERLRLSIMATHTREQMDQALKLIAEASKKYGII